MIADLDTRRRRAFRRRPRLRVALLTLVVGLCCLGIGVTGHVALNAAQQHAADLARSRVDRGAAIAMRLIDERRLRLGDQVQLVAQQPGLAEAMAARDILALNDVLIAVRNRYGTTTAAAVVDAAGRSIADQPPRQPYDYRQLSIVRNALQENQPSPVPVRTGVEARPNNANPLADLGPAAAYPVLVEGKPAGAVVLLSAITDGFAQQIADATGLDVALTRSDSLLAASRDVRALFQPPRVRPPGQLLAPVGSLHRLGDTLFVAASEPVRSWVTQPALATPMPTPAGGFPGRERPGPNANPQGPPILATLFVGQKQNDVLGALSDLRSALLVVLGVGILASAAGASALAGWLERPLAEATAAAAALVDGRTAPPLGAGAVRETAGLALTLEGALAANTGRVQTLRDELRKLEAVIDSVAEGIVVLDEHSQLVTINETAQRLLGLPDGLPAGTDLATVLTANQWDALRPALLRRDRASAEISLEEPRQAIVRVAAVPVLDDFARPLGRAIVLQDVTEERLLDNVKADFFTAMSHELRTPLSAIKGAAEVLLDDEMPAAQARFVETIHRNADRLGRLVTDLLDLGKLESGRTELRLSRVDLNEVVADAVAALQSVAERDGQRLVIKTEETPLSLIADPGRLEQIVTNLVSNACQYTPEGGQITVSAWRNGDLVFLEVADNGVGISTVDQQHLFDKFYQGVNTLTHKRGGSGLGLTIVKHLTELHGGSISVQSRLGEGSTFTVRLPAVPAVSLLPAPVLPSGQRDAVPTLSTDQRSVP